MEPEPTPQSQSDDSSPKEEIASSPETGEITSQSENDWAMVTHLSGLLALTSIPAIIGPLVVWLLKKDKMPKVDKAGKDAINFHLTMLLVVVVSIPLTFILIGFVTLFAAYLMSIIFSIIAGVAANRGEEYAYPMTIRFIR